MMSYCARVAGIPDGILPRPIQTFGNNLADLHAWAVGMCKAIGHRPGARVEIYEVKEALVATVLPTARDTAFVEKPAVRIIPSGAGV